MIYSNRKEIEMKNANQINVNQINNINLKETVYRKNKEFIKNDIKNKQNSFLIKRDNNLNNFVLIEIVHKKSKANKNLKEMKTKTMNDTSNSKPNQLILPNNNENININNNKNENLSDNINTNNLKPNIKYEIQKLNYENKIKDKKEKIPEKEIKKLDKKENENNKVINKNKNEKDFNKTKNDNKELTKLEDENKMQKTENKNIQKLYSRIHIRLSSSISKEKKDQRRLKNKDNIKLLYTYANNLNEDKIKKERKNNSNSNNKKKLIDNKNNNHSLYICDSFDTERKNKKYFSKNTIHKEYLSEQKFNYSFHSINLSHSKQKKLKLEKSEKNIKYQLFHQFSTTFQKKSSINLGLKKDKENFDSYHKNLEKILSKARNHKTISVQKLKTKIKKKIKEKEREKINEEVEIELDEIADKTNSNTIKSSSNSSNKINNNISKSSNKNILNKSPNHKKKKE